MDQAVKPWRRLAIIFPGQGSQYAGMGERLARVSRAARDVFKRADDVLDMRISKLCFEGTAEELEPTITQQPATFVTSIAWLAALQERWAQLDRKLEPVFFAGHSLGEFTAAVAAGSLSFEEGALLVQERGRLMDEAGREFPGGMASILGLPEAKVVEICQEASRDGYVGISNANCEGQTVISGAVNALKTAIETCRKGTTWHTTAVAETKRLSMPSELEDRLARRLPDKTAA